MQQARGVVQPLHVIAKPEDGRPLGRVVAANALEDTRAVVEAVDADVDLRVGPVDELAVHPDLLGLLHRARSFRLPGSALRECYPRAARSTIRAPGEPLQLGGRQRRHVRVACRRRSRRSRARAAPRSISVWVTARCGNGATPPGSKPVACTTSSAVARRGRRVRRPPRAIAASSARAVAGDEREHVGAVADEHERLDDLGELAADRASPRPARSGVPRRTPRSARRRPRRAGRPTTRSTGSGQDSSAFTI